MSINSINGINNQNLQNQNGVNANDPSVDVTTQQGQVDGLVGDINGNFNQNISTNSNGGLTTTLTTEQQNIVNEQEIAFLNAYNNGDLDNYDPRALILAGQYMLGQFAGDEERMSSTDHLTDMIGLYDVDAGTASDITFQAMDILNLVEGDTGVDTSEALRSDMVDLLLLGEGGENQADTDLIDSDALNTVLNLGESFEKLESKDVIIVGGWGRHSLGDLVADAGGIAGHANGLSSRNLDTTNDELFKSIFEKMSDADKERMALSPVIININSGEIVGEISMDELNAQHESGQVRMNWGDSGGDLYSWSSNAGASESAQSMEFITNDNATEDNSIEGQTIEFEGREYNVVDSTFRWASPIILDLDGDGIELTDNENGTIFDINGDGEKDRTSWTQSGQGFDDAFLVLDRNGNGEIDSGKELFGDQNGADNGYDELAKLDSNGDGQIDANDEAYSELQLWADMDGDGKVGDGELKTLEEMGVTSISTQYTGNVGEKFDEHGNDISLESTFTRMVDGEEVTRKTIDAFFLEAEATAKEKIDNSSVDSLTSDLMEMFKEVAILEDKSYVPPSDEELAEMAGMSQANVDLIAEIRKEEENEERIKEAILSGNLDEVEALISELVAAVSSYESELASISGQSAAYVPQQNQGNNQTVGVASEEGVNTPTSSVTSSTATSRTASGSDANSSRAATISQNKEQNLASLTAAQNEKSDLLSQLD